MKECKISGHFEINYRKTFTQIRKNDTMNTKLIVMEMMEITREAAYAIGQFACVFLRRGENVC